jgi:hypothetical protein
VEGGNVQLILLQDMDSITVKAIPDRTVTMLLKSLANTKGNNIIRLGTGNALTKDLASDMSLCFRLLSSTVAIPILDHGEMAVALHSP